MSFIEMVIALFFIWATIWFTTVSLSIGKWLAVFGSYVKLALLAIFVLLALVFFFGGHATGQHLGVGDILPTGNWGIIFSALFSLVLGFAISTIFKFAQFLIHGKGCTFLAPSGEFPRFLQHAIVHPRISPRFVTF